MKTYKVIVHVIGLELRQVRFSIMRTKSCRVCKKEENSVAHDCWRNYDGSAKSVESDMVVSVLRDMNEKGIKTATIVADDDSTTFCCLWAESDRNHVRENFLIRSLCFRKRTQIHQHPYENPYAYVELQLFHLLNQSITYNNRWGDICGLKRGDAVYAVCVQFLIGYMGINCSRTRLRF